MVRHMLTEEWCSFYTNGISFTKFIVRHWPEVCDNFLYATFAEK